MMNTINFITELFCKVDNNIDDKKHYQAKLYPSEVVTIALLYDLKGCGQEGSVGGSKKTTLHYFILYYVCQPKSGSPALLVIQPDQHLAGYVITRFRNRSKFARPYI